MESAALAALLALASPAPAPLPQTPSCVYSGRTGAAVPLSDLMAKARRSAVIHAGEKHDSPAHHARQAELVRDLGAAVGLEMLYASHQDALDRYLSGALDAAGFQSAVDWKKTWGFSFAIYQPVFDAARAGSRKGAALNVPKAIVHKVAESGLASLTPQERAFVPAGFQATADPAYLSMLRDTFEAHGGDPSDAAALARFVDAMSLWNEGMAANALAFLDRSPGTPIVLVEGAFHAYDAGVAASLERRRPGLAQTTIVFLEGPDCPASLPVSSLTADFLVVAP